MEELADGNPAFATIPTVITWSANGNDCFPMSGVASCVSQIPSRAFPLAQERLRPRTNRHRVDISPGPDGGSSGRFQGSRYLPSCVGVGLLKCGNQSTSFAGR